MTEKAKTVTNTKADSCAFFKPLWQIFKMLGITLDVDDSQRLLYTFYAAFINILATILYPLHLSLMLFRSETMAENIKNLAVSVTCVACSVKFIIYSTKLPLLRTFEGLLRQLDRRISVGEQLDYFRQLRRLMRYIAFTFLGIYSLIGISATLSFVFSEERRLLYPAYFPFNWKESTPKYLMANLYQSSVICVLLSQNYVDDCFPAMALCVLAGHISILSLRVANIGHANTSREENEEEMIRCVKDQKRLYELYLNIQDIISPAMFIQFGVTAINLCVAIVALLFYVSAPLDILYYFAYFLAMPMQIFPSCYYGSDVQYRFSQLHRSAFLSNWVDQSPMFKKHMILFTERSLKEHEVKAGGMFRVHLDTFFSTCKGAYSMFAVITRIK